MLYVWIAVLVLAIVAEAATSDLVAIWFVPAAILSLVLALFTVPRWVQVLAFIAVGLVLVIATRPLCRRLMKSSSTRTNAHCALFKSA